MEATRGPLHTPQRRLRIIILKPTHTCQLGSLLSLSCKFLPPNSEYFREEGRVRRLGPEVLNTCPDTLGKMWQFTLVRVRTKVDGHNPRIWGGRRWRDGASSKSVCVIEKTLGYTVTPCLKRYKKQQNKTADKGWKICFFRGWHKKGRLVRTCNQPAPNHDSVV